MYQADVVVVVVMHSIMIISGTRDRSVDVTSPLARTLVDDSFLIIL